MADGVDAPMNRVQSPRPNAMSHPVLAQASLPKLSHRDDAVLAGRNGGYPNVGTGALVAHIATKAPGPAHSPFGVG